MIDAAQHLPLGPPRQETYPNIRRTCRQIIQKRNGRAGQWDNIVVEQFVGQEPELLLEAKRFRVVRMSRFMADGSLHRHEVVVHPGAVVVLPLIAPDRVCLIRNFRIAVGETLIELPAGTLEPLEDPLETAYRELAEETGYRAGQMEKLCEFYMSPGILCERMHLFVATGLESGKTARESGEEIENLEVSWTEAMRLVESGQIRDAKTLTGLLFYDRIQCRQF